MKKQPAVTNAKLLAWEVEINCRTCIVFAATKAKAKWQAVKSYWDAVERTASWPACSIRRSSNYDKFPHKNERRAWSPEYVRNYI